jgi:hypothetical protein
MKIKPWGQSFLKIISILALIYGANSIYRIIDLHEGLTYILQVWNRTAIALIFYGGIGLILGLNHFTVEMKKKGVWKADWPKLIMLGVPSLFYAFSFAISVYGGPVFGPIPYILAKPLIIDNHRGIICLFSLILGHTIITGFYKYDANHPEQSKG